MPSKRTPLPSPPTLWQLKKHNRGKQSSRGARRASWYKYLNKARLIAAVGRRVGNSEITPKLCERLSQDHVWSGVPAPVANFDEALQIHRQVRPTSGQDRHSSLRRRQKLLSSCSTEDFMNNVWDISVFLSGGPSGGKSSGKYVPRIWFATPVERAGSTCSA